jgi:hypothetical protein
MNPLDIKLYGSGALSDGGFQPNPEAYLGGYRSSTEIPNKKAVTAPATITGVTIDFASVANTNASGTLTYTLTDNKLQWTASGDSIGLALSFTADATKVLYSNDESMFIQVTVDFSALPVGAAGPDSITISEHIDTMNNIYDDVTNFEIVDGFIEHRGFFIKNTHALDTLYTPKIFISLNTAFANDFIEFGFEEPSSRNGGFIQTILDSNHMPTDIGTITSGNSIWSRVTTKPTAILFPGVQELAPNELMGLWYRRVVSAGAGKYANNIFNITVVGEIAILEN